MYICNGCVDLAKSVISENEPASTPIAELSAGTEQEPPEQEPPEQEYRVQCSFCGKRRDQATALVVSSALTSRNSPATICAECLGLCSEIITEELGDPAT